MTARFHGDGTCEDCGCLAPQHHPECGFVVPAHERSRKPVAAPEHAEACDAFLATVRDLLDRVPTYAREPLMVAAKGMVQASQVAADRICAKTDRRLAEIESRATELQALAAHDGRIRAAVAAEREACAKVCDEIARKTKPYGCSASLAMAEECADAIRARSTP